MARTSTYVLGKGKLISVNLCLGLGVLNPVSSKCFECGIFFVWFSLPTIVFHGISLCFDQLYICI